MCDIFIAEDVDSSAAGEELRVESAGLASNLLQLREARRLCQDARREAAAAAAAAVSAPGRAEGGCQQATHTVFKCSQELIILPISSA